MQKSHNELCMMLARGSMDEYYTMQVSSIADFTLRYELYIKDIESKLVKK